MIPIGTPASYTDSSGNVYAGLMTADDEVLYFDSSVSRWTFSSGATRDDTTATHNSYAIIQITSSFTGT
jgi:hypothetical protein